MCHFSRQRYQSISTAKSSINENSDNALVLATPKANSRLATKHIDANSHTTIILKHSQSTLMCCLRTQHEWKPEREGNERTVIITKLCRCRHRANATQSGQRSLCSCEPGTLTAHRMEVTLQMGGNFIPLIFLLFGWMLPILYYTIRGMTKMIHNDKHFIFNFHTNLMKWPKTDIICCIFCSKYTF